MFAHIGRGKARAPAPPSEFDICMVDDLAAKYEWNIEFRHGVYPNCRAMNSSALSCASVAPAQVILSSFPSISVKRRISEWMIGPARPQAQGWFQVIVTRSPLRSPPQWVSMVKSNHP